MKSFAAAVASLFLVASTASAQSGQMITVTRVGSQPSSAGSANNFTGSVRVDSRFQASAPARVGGGIVTFEPGARTAWHTHPLGQTLYITSGCGWVQSEGGPVREVRPGDIVQIPPKVRHWHGASAGEAMAHLAVVELLDGIRVTWMEHVSDEDYAEGATSSPTCAG